MNIKELNIGDWVSYYKCSDAVQILGIDSRKGKCVVMSDSCYPSGVIGFIENVHPITLTPEILKRSGFIQLEPSVNYDWWCLDNKDKFLVGFGFGKEEGKTATGWDFDTVGSCDYKRQIGVHELPTPFAWRA